MTNISRYKERKKQAIEECVRSVLKKLALCLIPCFFILCVCLTYDSDNSAERARDIFFMFAAVIGLCFLSYRIYAVIHETVKKIAGYKLGYGITESPGVKLRRKILICATALVFAVCILAIPISAAVKTSSAYNTGKELAAARKYEEAIECFEGIKDKNYRDSESLRYLCKAFVKYNAGSVAGAASELNKVDFLNISVEFSQIAKKLNDKVDEEYSAMLREKDEEDKKAEEERIRSGVPFVGMSESRINDTSLGKASGEIRHNTEMVHGQPYKANIYDFYKDGKLIFTARCVEDMVVQVWDKRDEQDVDIVYVYDNGENSQKGSGVKSNDSFNTDEYSDAEEFYYWNAEDFVDYEDAEEYYNKHSGK